MLKSFMNFMKQRDFNTESDFSDLEKLKNILK